jgi:hypothetical protein
MMIRHRRTATSGKRSLNENISRLADGKCLMVLETLNLEVDIYLKNCSHWRGISFCPNCLQLLGEALWIAEHSRRSVVEWFSFVADVDKD